MESNTGKRRNWKMKKLIVLAICAMAVTFIVGLSIAEETKTDSQPADAAPAMTNASSVTPAK